MSRPVIGITMSCAPNPHTADGTERLHVGRGYADCLVEAGATPLLIPFQAPVSEIIGLLDGWLIPGGDDFDAALFGEENHPEAKREHPARFAQEKEIYELAPESMPILGICYGCQFLNIVRGGSLIQHLPDVVGNDHHRAGELDRYAVEDGSLAAAALGGTCAEGRSHHHQAINRVGQDLKVVSRADDGVIEAVEDTTGRWLLGLQWHPEKTPENPSTKHLFKQFVAQAAEYRKSR